MAYSGSYREDELSSLRSEGREPGARRKKLAGYLKAANELRQNYFSQEGGPGGARDWNDDSGVEGPGAFPDAAVVRSGNEEMVLFPSYARRHVKRKQAPPPTSGEVSEQDYWRKEWEKHEDDKAVVDVDVRGWIYTPHRGQANRKQRLMLGLARQLVGLPAPPAASKSEDAAYSSQASSRNPSPRPSKQDEEFIAREAENIVRKGEQESQFARQGAYSEKPAQDRDGDSVYNYTSGSSSRQTSPERLHRMSQASVASSVDGDSGAITPLHKRSSWPQPAKMTSAELAVANQHLLSRLRPFLANPLANTVISAFFYNESASRQHTVYTNASGHFHCRAPLDFVPTHVRVLAAEKLSATEEVTITSQKGVSVISDIDDTIKHSAISYGAREIFRNAFIRELGDLTIDGVKEWYNTLHDMGVGFHYVSNSPWQLYPVLTSYFKLAHLPRGSFHLKEYTGMLQGIFEPVAERKKSSLEKIMRDFPDRKFILIGDSGEADLEVYTDVALDNPGRILGIFIRDVTTPVKAGYFDPSNGGSGGGGKQFRNHSRHRSGDSLATSKRISRPNDVRDDDADLRAAVAASLQDMEAETRRARQAINPDSPSPEGIDTPQARPALPARRSTARLNTEKPVVAEPEEDLIDFSEETAPDQQWLAPPPRRSDQRRISGLDGSSGSRPSPSPPPKPSSLRSPSPNARRTSTSPESTIKAPPPRPRKPSSAVKPPSPSQVETWTSKPQHPPATPSQHQRSPLSQVTQLSPEAKTKPSLPTRPKNNGVLGQGRAHTQTGGSHGSFWNSQAAAGQPRPDLTSVGSQAETPRAMSTTSLQFSNASNPATSAAKTAATRKQAPPPPPPPRPRVRNAASSYSTATRKAANRLSGGNWDDGSGGSLPGSPGEAGMSKKEFLWNQRWARAKSTLERQGVTLRSWRVGSDVADVCVRLVEQALREIEREEKRKEN